jgi:hypothetical protein
MHNFNLLIHFQINVKRIDLHLKIYTIMFEQYIGDGANLFIIIVAVLVGFATALGYLDFTKTKKDEKKG